jgi:hypothetical protein
VNLKGILIAVSLVISSFALAQSGAKTGGQTKTGSQRIKIGNRVIQRRTPEQKVEQLAKTVNLTVDQKSKVLAVYKAGVAKRKAIFEDKKLSFDEKRIGFEKIGSGIDAQLKTILTKDQLKKLEGLRKQRVGAPLSP